MSSLCLVDNYNNNSGGGENTFFKLAHKLQAWSMIQYGVHVIDYGTEIPFVMLHAFCNTIYSDIIFLIVDDDMLRYIVYFY